MLDFLQNVQLRLLEEQAKKEAPPGPIWSTTYKWYINPILQCNYCKEWLETRRVWVVDEVAWKVVAAYDVGGGRAINVVRCHPHVGSAGAICKGNAQSVAEALFHGLSEDAYEKPYEWLPKVLGHECDEMRARRDENTIICTSCDEEVHIDDSYYSEDTGYRYCGDCYWECHWRCEGCEGEWHEGSRESYHNVDDSAYCSECFSDHYFICEGCDNTFNHIDCAGDNRCQDCYDELWESCVDCRDDHLREDNMLDSNGQCADCRPSAEEEEEEDAE